MANLDNKLLKQLEAELIAQNAELEDLLQNPVESATTSEDDTENENGENEKSTDKRSTYILFKLKHVASDQSKKYGLGQGS